MRVLSLFVFTGTAGFSPALSAKREKGKGEYALQKVRAFGSSCGRSQHPIDACLNV